MLKRNCCITLIFTLVLTLFVNSFTYIEAYEKRISYVRLNNGQPLKLEIGDVKKLDVNIYPEDAKVNKITFSSKNNEIATISSKGIIKALKVGKTTITVNIDHRVSHIRVEVIKDKCLLAKFSEKEIVKNKIKEVSIDAFRKDGKDAYCYIYLPNGYLVEGNKATYTVDRNGSYPFTVYYGNGIKKTFIYEEKKLTHNIPNSNTTNNSNDKNDDKDNFDINILKNNINLEYDYEKKQVLFKAKLDKNRSIIYPDNKSEINNTLTYFLSRIENGKSYDYTFTVENKKLKCKLIRQGEYYLLVLINYLKNDTRNILTTYRAYNFCSKSLLNTNPTSDYICENGNYTVEAFSQTGLREIFNIPIHDIDYIKPTIEIALTSDKTFEVIAKDNYKLDYIINYDGKYIKVQDNKNTCSEFKYITAPYLYKGSYIFTAVDTHGNRTNYTNIIKDGRSAPYIYYMGIEAHNTYLANNIFKDIGTDNGYLMNDNNDFKDIVVFENKFPSYMRGNNSNEFKPNSTITRAEMITILCRITNLPYDITLMNKNRYTDIDNHWAKHYICMGNRKRYINGYRDKTFRPDCNLTRADFCQMLCNISTLKTNLNSIPAIYNYDFDDINQLKAKPYILKLANRGIIKGYNSKFYPNVPIKKYEVIYAINKLFNISPSKEEMNFIENTYNKYYNYTDIKNHPNYKDIIISLIGNYVEKKEFN